MTNMFDAFTVAIAIVFAYRTGEVLAMTKMKFVTLVLWVFAIKFISVIYAS
tara:strand:- start:41 stop:193 length:153 start_codon:yes stop_codon:yes gene_type:complete